MLNFLRRSASSVFAWIILGVLAVVFGLSFGLPTDQIAYGTAPLVRAHGTRVGDEAYRFQYNLIRGVLQGVPDEVLARPAFKQGVLESILEREVLLELGEEMGLAATVTDAEDLIANNHVLVLGDTHPWLGPNTAFDYDLFKNSFLRQMQTSEKAYLEAQRREYLARTVRDLIQSSVVVSEAELRDRYEAQANKLDIRYARYPHAEFGQLVDPTDEDIAGWLEKHQAELEAEYAKQGSRFLKLPPQSRVQIVEVPEGEDAAAAKAAIEAARQRIEGGESFAAVAREVSAHASAPAGGDLGWVTTKAGTGVAPVVDEAVAGLEAGALSEVLEGDGSFYLVRVESKRQGDLPKEDALRELAVEALRRARGQALAEQAAREDLQAIQAGKPPEEVFAGDRVEFRDTGLFARGEPIPALGTSPELIEAVWDADPETTFVDQVFEVGNATVLAGLAKKEEATDEGYAEARDDLYEIARLQKGAQVTARLAGYLCEDAKARGNVVPNPERIAQVVSYAGQGEDAQPAPSYEVCQRLREREGFSIAELFGEG